MVSSIRDMETGRMAAIRQLQVLGTPPEKDLDDTAALAAHICEAPVAVIAFEGDEHFWFKARFGTDADRVPRDHPFFSHAARPDGMIVIPDTGEEDLPAGGAIRYFAAAPMVNEDSFLLGYLCIMDRRPRLPDEGQLSGLRMLAKQVLTVLKMRVQILKLQKGEEESRDDITLRIEATRKLDEQKAFYENILNVLPADIAVFDANHKYLFVNPRGIKDPDLRRYIIGKDDFEYAEYRNRDKSVAQVRRDQFMEVKRSGLEIRWEDTVKAPDGTPNTSLRRLFPVFDEYGTLQLVIGFGVDITDRKIMEEKQAAMLNQLSVQNTQLIDFCNIVSHNLRAPLVNMSMLVDFIEEGEDKEEQMMLISKLRPVIDNLHTTFNELVESIQIRQDLEVTSENVNLADCLERTLEGLKIEMNNSDAVITQDFSEAATIYFPSKYMFSIFHNLVSNALKYQSPKRKPEIKVRTVRKDDHIILSVADNGLGIDMTKHKDSMFKIGKVFHYHPNSKGFGLFMTKTQVEAMGGVIWVESIPDQGATFFIDFKNQIS